MKPLTVYCWLCGTRSAALVETVGSQAVRWSCAPCDTSQITGITLSDVAEVARLNGISAADGVLDNLDEVASDA